MTSNESETVYGPIDFLLLEGRAENMTGEAAAALLDLVERGIIRIYDLLAVRKEADGSFSGVELKDLSQDGLGGFAAFAGARSGCSVTTTSPKRRTRSRPEPSVC